MRRIRRTAAFKRDCRRERKGRFAKALDDDLANVLADLAWDRPLAPKHRDHELAGSWKDHRDCRVRPDLILVYRKPDADHLDLVRLGSHGKLSP